jgi:hypothetical protein
VEDTPISPFAEGEQAAEPPVTTAQESEPNEDVSTPKRRGRKPKSESQASERSVLRRARNSEADKLEKALLKHKRKDKTDIPANAEESITLQYAGQDLDIAELRKKVIAAHIEAGHRAGRISKLNLYIKPEDLKVYYVINDKISGSIDF